MLPLVTAGLSLLQQKQKNDADKKKARMSALMGEAPSAESGDGKAGKLGMLTNVIGLLGNMGGDKTPDKGTDLGSARYNEKMPSMDGSGMTEGTQNYLDDKFGTPGSVSNASLLGKMKTPEQPDYNGLDYDVLGMTQGQHDDENLY